MGLRFKMTYELLTTIGRDIIAKILIILKILTLGNLNINKKNIYSFLIYTKFARLINEI
jgi:hypothetical protein